jgi:hypothetical protein
MSLSPKSFTDKAVELRKILFKEIKNFLIKNEAKLSQKDGFMLPSIAMSSVIAEITYRMFNKDAPLSIKKSYIDDLCTAAKEQLEMAEAEDNDRNRKND